MNNQLSNISTQYRKFSKGQYVDDTQFNEFLDFFEDQDRLSRVMLQGVGIVCGFKPELIFGDGMLKNIQLSQGIAVTTDGDLLSLNKTSQVSEELYVSDLKTINLESKNYTHFKVYDNFKINYPAFYEGENQIELFELATAEESNSDFQTLNSLLNLEDKYLLLYLESYEKEIKPCRGVDCDNHGIQQIRNLKVLITNKDGIDHILETDQIQPHPLFSEDILESVKQERVILERLILEKGNDFDFSFSDVKELYSSVLQRNNYGETVFKKIGEISRIIGVPVASFQNFRDLVEECLSQPFGFQYAYDVVNDLMATYAEIIKFIPTSFTKCFPDLNSFPKHIMLGKLTSTNQLDSKRHRFYNSPVLDTGKEMQKIKALIHRFNLQAQNFHYSFADNSETEIKITHSKKLGELSNKAIPFYYQLTDEFLKAWNFDKTGNRLFRNNLTYDKSLLSSDFHVQNPNNYNIDRNSFFNIEGHQGMNSHEAFDKIKKISAEKQLGFDVMLLSLAELETNKDMFKAYFNEYLEKHPGLEHKRGVEHGGTFVLLCENTESNESRIIADFSLPYICCTPKIDVKLSLPSAIICAKSEPIPFTVFPMNGDVKAVVDSGNGGVIQIDGKYYFDPATLEQKWYGKEISFTVNGVSTSCIVKVIDQPDINVVADSVSFPTAGSFDTEVKFKISGENITDYNYLWDFWDNGDLVNLIPDENGIISYIFHDLNPKIIPTIKVHIGSGGCSEIIEIDDWYNAPELPSVSIRNLIFSPENCCENIVPSITAEATGPGRFLLSGETLILNGKGFGALKLLYSWTKISGPSAKLTIVNRPDLEVTDLEEGEYIFMLTVVDAESGVFAHSEEVTVTVYTER